VHTILGWKFDIRRKRENMGWKILIDASYKYALKKLYTKLKQIVFSILPKVLAFQSDSQQMILN
jgi:hypothetical protein